MGRRGTCVWFGDVPVGLQAADADRLALVQRVVGRLELADAEPVAWLRIVDAAPPVPARAPDVSEHATSLWIDGEELVVELGGSVARAGATAATIGGIDAADAGVVRRLLLPAMTHVLAAHDRFVLHGAAAVAPAGRGRDRRCVGSGQVDRRVRRAKRGGPCSPTTW